MSWERLSIKRKIKRREDREKVIPKLKTTTIRHKNILRETKEDSEFGGKMKSILLLVLVFAVVIFVSAHNIPDSKEHKDHTSEGPDHVSFVCRDLF